MVAVAPSMMGPASPVISWDLCWYCGESLIGVRVIGTNSSVPVLV